MIDVFTGYLGGQVPCSWCKHPLTLSSDYNYERCHHCGSIQYERPKEANLLTKLFRYAAQKFSPKRLR